MSVNLKTNCRDCIHEKVCKKRCYPKLFNERLGDLTYGSGPNDDYSWRTMSDYYRVQIDISCMDFEKRIPVSKKAVDLSKYVSD